MKSNPKETKAFRQHLRNEPTQAEKYLWEFLKGKRFHGLKFRRQQGIGSLIVDFYCAEKQVAIELDGEIHKHQLVYDDAREKHLLDHGVRIIRFENREVIQDVASVLFALELFIGIQPPQPLLEKEGQIGH